MPKIANDWLAVIGSEFEKIYYKQLNDFLAKEYASKNIYPAKEDIFNAFKYTPYKNVKVLLIGQDPYHNINQAHGLSFSVKPNSPIPPSLKNIYKELQSDIGCSIPNNGYLKKWAEQGVLLLNAVLTVQEHTANSHKAKGWEQFTDAVIKTINNIDRPIVVFLWGTTAEKKRAMLTNPRHLVLQAPHPSPLSAYRGFLGCKHFSKANNFLLANKQTPIDWQIENI